MSGHPRHPLDAVLDASVRLSIVAYLLSVVACLAAATRAEFAFVGDAVEASDSAGVFEAHLPALTAVAALPVVSASSGRSAPHG